MKEKVSVEERLRIASMIRNQNHNNNELMKNRESIVYGANKQYMNTEENDYVRTVFIGFILRLSVSCLLFAVLWYMDYRQLSLGDISVNTIISLFYTKPL